MTMKAQQRWKTSSYPLTPNQNFQEAIHPTNYTTIKTQGGQEELTEDKTVNYFGFLMSLRQMKGLQRH